MIKESKRRRNRVLSMDEILAAQAICGSANDCARELDIGIVLYKKYATLHGIYDRCLNKSGNGIQKPIDPNKAQHKITDIINNKHKNANPKIVLQKLISANLKRNECENCGFCENRVIDDVIPLALCFKDKNRKNFKIKNLKVCCYNCAHNIYHVQFEVKTRYEYSRKSKMDGRRKENKGRKHKGVNRSTKSIDPISE